MNAAHPSDSYRKDPHCKPARAVNLIGAGAIGETRSDDHVCLRVTHRIEQHSDLCRVMLSVPVDLDDRVEAVLQRPAEAAAQRTTDAEVYRQT
jgi:hypothetical protein